jgi:hypothetical protein
LLQLLPLTDADFLGNLVSTRDWIGVIGNRDLNSESAVLKYTQSILDHPEVIYLMVRLKDFQTPVGIISLVKREYLFINDPGYAFCLTIRKSKRV